MVGASAMTLGHVILGRDPFCLDICRDHEQAHVRQVERWGGAFIPAYFLASVLAWRLGQHYYRDNWFERDARRRCGEDDWQGMIERPVERSARGLPTTQKRHPPMPQSPHVIHAPHIEKHFTASEFVRDVVIGMSDGLTVPFALAAGLTGNAATAVTSIIVTAGLAEIAAGSIAMGLGGFLAARSDAEHYESERHREEREVAELPDLERAEVAQLFRDYGLSEDHIEPILQAFESNPKAWVDFMMRYELGLEEPDPRRALKSALTIAGAYVAGGLIPLAPYMVTSNARSAVVFSVLVTLTALAVFGYIKGHYTGTRPFRSALQTAVIGGLAAAAAFLIARVFS
jgi:VIT1/CCC1 family predicted Fe2+/Mn2+ transporter